MFYQYLTLQRRNLSMLRRNASMFSENGGHIFNLQQKNAETCLCFQNIVKCNAEVCLCNAEICLCLLKFAHFGRFCVILTTFWSFLTIFFVFHFNFPLKNAETCLCFLFIHQIDAETCLCYAEICLCS